MKDYLGDGVYVEYLKDSDDIKISTLRLSGEHFIFLSRLEYYALRRFAKQAGWEEAINTYEENKS